MDLDPYFIFFSEVDTKLLIHLEDREAQMSKEIIYPTNTDGSERLDSIGPSAYVYVTSLLG